MGQVCTDIIFKPSETRQEHEGFFLDGYLVSNFENYAVPSVANKFDFVMAITGMEGSGKSTLATSLAKFVDPTFPGELLNDPDFPQRRNCERIVFTNQQIMDVIDNAKVGQAIVIDEAILSMSSQDFAADLQKILIKKFVTIRKKRLYIFVVVPSIFLLRKYFAVFRTKCLIHCVVEDMYKRGRFNFFSYDNKRILYLRGMKEFDQSCVKPDFYGTFVDTEGFFFDPEEYDEKKEAAIRDLTAEKEPEEKGSNTNTSKIFRQVFLDFYNDYKIKNPKATTLDFSIYLQGRYPNASIGDKQIHAIKTLAQKERETFTA